MSVGLRPHVALFRAVRNQPGDGIGENHRCSGTGDSACNASKNTVTALAARRPRARFERAVDHLATARPNPLRSMSCRHVQLVERAIAVLVGQVDGIESRARSRPGRGPVEGRCACAVPAPKAFAACASAASRSLVVGLDPTGTLASAATLR